MTYFYSTKTWTSQPQISEDQIEYWKHLSEKKNWRITQLPNGFYQTEYKDQDDSWQDVTRRETIDGAEAAIDGSIQHYQKRLDFLKAGGKCVIYEDALGKPVITKDGVTVAESVVLLHPVENIGATLIKEAAQNTVKEAGDGTTTATVLAHAILKLASETSEDLPIRDLKIGLDSGYAKIIDY